MTINETKMNLGVGEKHKLVATSSTNGEIMWESSDSNIAMVDIDGNVVGLAEGKAVITAKIEGTDENASCEVSVFSISLNETKISIGVGKSHKLTATASISSDAEIVWESSNPNVALVDYQGNVTALAEGQAVVTAKIDGTNICATCDVQVIEVISITLSETKINLGVGETHKLAATASAGAEIVWESSDPNVAIVGTEGNVTAVAEGKAVITAKVKGTDVSSSCEVDVVTNVSITLGETNINLKVGETHKLVATASAGAEIAWESSDPNIAKVDAEGNVTAVAEGKAVIKAKVEGTGVYVACEVYVAASASITLGETKIKLGIGETHKLIATAAAGVEIVWESSDPSVAIVDAEGNVTAFGEGKAVITAKIEGTDVSVTCEVYVAAAASITLSETKINLGAGGSHKLVASASADAKIVWESSDPNVAKVDAEGNVTAVAEGKAVIIAKIEGTDVSVTCEVYAAAAANITLSEPKINLGAGGSHKLVASASADAKIVWESSDPKVAKVDAEGNVTAVAEGKAVIAAKIEGTGEYVTCEVYVAARASITLNEAKVSIGVGGTYKLVASASVDAKIVWESSDPKVATVDAQGNVTAVASGSAVITAKIEGTDVSVTCEVRIIANVSIKLSEAKVSLGAGGTYKLTATASADAKVVWESSDPNVAKVDAQGNVTAVASGSAIITAKVEGTDAYVTCKVEVSASAGVSIALNEVKVSLGAGGTYKLVASAAADAKVVWESSDPNVAKVDAEGNVTAVASGSAVITAKVEGTDAHVTCEVEVSASASVNIALNEAKVSLGAGGTYKLVATASADAKVVWESSNPNVVTVDGEGNVTAVASASGSAVITAKVEGTDAHVTCEVEVSASASVSIALNKANVALGAGGTYKLVATASADAKVVWESSNPNVVTVDAEGNVTAVAEGKAVVTAKVDGTDASITCEVVVSASVSVTLSESNITLGTGGTYKLVATASAGAKIVWESSDPKVATVDAQGNVTAVASGSAVITAKVEGTNVYVTCKVEVAVSVSITLNESNIALGAGGTYKLVATASAGAKIVWESSDPKVATVDAQGNVTAVASGSAVITAKVEGTNVSVTCKVEVTVSVSITLNETNISLGAGGTYKLVATASAGAKIVWESSNPKVATVDAQGNVTAVASGSAVITAKIEGTNVSVACKVEVTVSVSIQLSEANVSLSVGGTYKLVATASAGAKIVWESSNPKVATVDVQGNVTAVAGGKVVITAQIEGTNVSASCGVEVTANASVSIAISEANISLSVGATHKLVATASAGAKIVWESGNPKVAKVDAEGNVTAVAIGKVVIIARIEGTSYYVTCEVEVTAIVSIILNQTQVCLQEGDKYKLVATVSASVTAGIAWTSSDTRVATVDTEGNVTAIGIGTVVITAQIIGTNCKAICIIIVTTQPTTDHKVILNIEPGKSIINLEGNISLNYTINNVKNIAAEDAIIKYDINKLKFLGMSETKGIKLVRSEENYDELRVITTSEGLATIVNDSRILLKLYFQGIAPGEALVDVIKGKISDGIEMERDLEDYECGQAIVVIDEVKVDDVNHSGEFTLLDLAIDARHLGEDPKTLPQYNTDQVIDGVIDNKDLLKIGEYIMANQNYKFK